MPTPELEKFRAKYPDYGDMDDSTLAQKLADKYPDSYGDLPGKVKATSEPPDDTITHEEVPGKSIGGFVSNVGKSAYKVGAGLYDIGKDILTNPQGPMARKALGVPEEDPKYKAVMSAVSEPFVKAFKNPPGIPAQIGNYLYEDPVSAALNVAPFVPGIARMAGSLNPMAEAVIQADKYASKLPLLRETIVKEFEKGVRPSVAKRGTWPQVQAYYDNAESAVKSIIDSKDSLKYTTPSGEVVSGKSVV